MTAPDAMAVPVHEQAPAGPTEGFVRLSLQASDTVRELDDFQLAQASGVAGRRGQKTR